jgi:hypothetical protein
MEKEGFEKNFTTGSWMCGKERTLSPLFVEVWQLKELRARLSDVWQGKDLGEKSAQRAGCQVAAGVGLGMERVRIERELAKLTFGE